MKESEIRPEAIFDEYLKLSKEDIARYFTIDERQSIPCPACGQQGSFSFSKHNFIYEECSGCQTLFVSPRPSAQAFSHYYQESESIKYWASTFYKETAAARREKLWKPKAVMVKDLINQFGSLDYSVIDIGGGYGIFAEEFEKISGNPVTVIEPGPELAEICRGKGLRVVEHFLEEIETQQLPAGKKAFVSFELFEHLHAPEYFLGSLYNLMVAGDFFIFTTLSGSGVDIQALWEDSKSVSPPHHLNFFNPKSTQILLERMGFDVLQITTPGKLDMDILFNNQNDIKDRFWKTFINQSTEMERHDMQLFIQQANLSSHMLVVCKKSGVN